MKPVRLVLPKLDGVGMNPEASPVGWACDHLSLKTSLIFFNSRKQMFSISDSYRLRGRPGPKLTAPWTTLEIPVGFFIADLGHRAGYSHLFPQGAPEKYQGSNRIGFQFMAFSAGIVCEKNKPSDINVSHKDHPGGGNAVLGGRCQGHRIRKRYLRSDGFLIPGIELVEWIWRDPVNF